MLIQPQLAAVRPRVVLSDGTELPLEDEIQRLVDSGSSGFVAIIGPPGSGKTTALAHLAAVLPSNSNLSLHDLADSDSIVTDEFARDRLYVFAAPFTEARMHVAVYQLALWSRDDFIEYLLGRHREKCASVIRRIEPDDTNRFDGNPELWSILLDQLANDESLRNANSALRRYLQLQLPDTDIVQRSRSACLNLLTAENSERQLAKLFAPPGFPRPVIRVLRHSSVQFQLASERIVADLGGEESCDFLACRLPRELVRCAARELRPGGKEIDRLREFLAGPAWRHPMAVSLLHAAGTDWKPNGLISNLKGAYLEGVDWPNVNLTHASRSNLDLSEADLSAGNLNGAVLDNAQAGRTCFRRCRLRGASLNGVCAESADFRGADLSGACARAAMFDGADLSQAQAESAEFPMATFVAAKLKSANFACADLRTANFDEVEVDDVDFTSADLSCASLANLDLRCCSFRRARLTRANLCRSNFEGLEFDDADFEHATLSGALLTGCTIRNGNLRHANLRKAGLGEINWENCDLRGADFAGASFHMGSSRSGLLFTTIASEGTRTGFYTDDYDERSFKEPEEIRKANLCRCDLRDAHVTETDFYLVDLRGAIYQESQKDHFKRCGAILGRCE